MRCSPICIAEHGQKFCGDGLGDGRVTGSDRYDLDRDGDGVGCDS